VGIHAVSASYCIGQALEIAATPRDTWAAQIERLPQGCSHADCGPPRCCRARIADYLRVQYRIQVQLEKTVPRRRSGAR